MDLKIADEKTDTGKNIDSFDLIKAALAGDAASVRSLLASKADIDARDSNGHTVLMAAIFTSADSKDYDRNNALGLAAKMDCLQLLIDAIRCYCSNAGSEPGPDCVRAGATQSEG